MHAGSRRPAFLSAFLSLVTLGGMAESGPDDDPDALAPGAVARFSTTDGPRPLATRVVSSLVWDWGTGSPDSRIPADRFRLSAAASLLVQAPGTYRFFARADGHAVVRVGDRVAIEGPPGTARSTALELKPGFTPLTLEYR